MKRHAAFPDGDDFQRMRKIIGRVIEKDFAKPPADDNAQHAIKEHVIQMVAPPSGSGDVGLLCTNAAQQQKLRERQQVHQAVPVHTQRTDGKCDRVR